MEVPGAANGEAGKMAIILDGKNYLPKTIKMDAGKNAEGVQEGMTVTFSNAKVLKDIKEFGEGAWKFEVPEGTIVNDMTAMLQMMMAQMMPAGGDEEELEF